VCHRRALFDRRRAADRHGPARDRKGTTSSAQRPTNARSRYDRPFEHMLERQLQVADGTAFAERKSEAKKRGDVALWPRVFLTAIRTDREGRAHNEKGQACTRRSRPLPRDPAFRHHGEGGGSQTPIPSWCRIRKASQWKDRLIKATRSGATGFAAVGSRRRSSAERRRGL